jgi:hypothetical protein
VELFEILFILFFIMIPVLEGIRKSRQRRRAEQIEPPEEVDRPAAARPAPPPRRSSYEAPARRAPGPRPPPEPEPVEASDMIPEDLWEILTGERRQRPAPHRPVPVPEEPPPTEPWWEAEEEAVEERFEPRPWREDEPPLEEPAPPVPPPAPIEEPTRRVESPRGRPARRRVPLSETMDVEPVRRQMSPLLQALQQREGLRQAILLKEILDRPKGLQP